MAKTKGMLPPGATEDLADALRGFRSMAPNVICGVEVSAGSDGCLAAMKQKGTVYPLHGEVPTLPFPGCDRSPCCACCYLPVLPDG